MEETRNFEPAVEVPNVTRDDPALDLERLWQAGETPELGTFLARLGELSTRQLVGVLRIDQHKRWERKERIPAEIYLSRFPSLQADADSCLELVSGEYHLRLELGEKPTLTEYQSRFPQLAQGLSRLCRPGTHVPTRHGGGALPTLPGYELIEVLGRGGMGVVYKARQRNLHRLVALKMVLAGAHASPNELKRFRIEAEAVARLQHPNIVQIHEVGEHDGLPFFSLEYVDGGSLDEVLGGTPQPVRLAAELVEKLALAVHCAHQSGIVHRDLKPANILLQGSAVRTQGSGVQTQGTGIRVLSKTQKDGAEGSGATPAGEPAQSLIPKITDFGLAKCLQGEGGEAGARGLTQSGAIIGTPSYMAPEQAGRSATPVGPAADTYALGAILYEMLTGRPPFQGETSMDIMVLVLSEEPVPPSRLRPRLPRDLETICLKCLQKEPRKRYASAEALADDLRRFLDGKAIAARPVGRIERLWRWGVRNPVVAALLVVLALVVAGGFGAVTSQWLRAEKHLEEARQERVRAQANEKKANQERVRAEKAFQDARRAVDDYYTRVSENKLLGVPGLEPLRRDLLEAALTYYQKFAEENRSDPKVRADLATAYFRLATITELIGSKRKAHDFYRKTIALFEQLVREKNAADLWLRRLGVCCNDFALSLMETGQVKTAERYLARSREVLEELVAARAANPEFEAALAKCLLNTALCHCRQGRIRNAVDCYQKCRAIQERIVRRTPLLSEYQSDLALTYMNLGSIYLENGQPELALAEYRKTLAIELRLVALHPEAIYYRRLLGAVYHNIGMLYRLGSRYGEALANYRKSVRLREVLALGHPNVSDYQNDLAETLNNIGELELASRDRKAAQVTLGRAAEIFQQLATKNASNTKYRSAEALAQNNLGVVLHQMDRNTEALEHHQKALAIRSRLIQEHPETVDYQSYLADTHSNLGNSQRVLGQLDEAAASYRKAIALYEPLRSAHPSMTKYAGNLALSLTNLGYLEEERERWSLALEAFRASLAIRKELARNSSVPRFLADLAQSHFCIGKVLSKTGRGGEAKDSYEEALRLQERLVVRARVLGQTGPLGRQAAAIGRGPLEVLAALQPQGESVPDAALNDFEADVARTFIQIGNLKRDGGDLFAAFGWYKKARELWARVVAVAPQVAEFQSNLAVSHYNFGLTLQDLRLALAALQAHQLGRDIREQLVRDHPNDLTYRRQFGESHNSVGIAQLSLRRRAEAEASFKKARDVWQELVARKPDKARYLSDLGRAYLNIGITLNEAQRDREAEPLLEEGLRWQWQAQTREPYNFRFRDLLNKTYTRLARVQRALGRPADAAATTAERLKLWPTRLDEQISRGGGRTLFPGVCLLLTLASLNEQVVAAGELAQCIPLVGRGKAQLTETEKAERDRYEAQALALLRKAVGGGFCDIRLLEKADFDPLRSSAGFRKLWAGLKGEPMRKGH
jgi:serine/threonine-protein kinase